jgi:acyl-CoA thioester hydrolase
MTPEAKVTVPLRWRDMDMLGHLNQSVYHELLEEVRGALFMSLFDMQGFPFVLARVELDYRHEVRHDHGSVELIARIDRVGTTSVTVAHEMLLPDRTLAAEGASVLVAWDAEARGSRPLSDAERQALTG